MNNNFPEVAQYTESAQSLGEDYITPSETTNTLLLLCFTVSKDPRSAPIFKGALDECASELVDARDMFYQQVSEEGLVDCIPNTIKAVMDSFEGYAQSLIYAKSWFVEPNNYPLFRAAELIRDAYLDLHDALLAYEWDYLSQGDEPHPAINLMQKVIAATKQGIVDDNRLDEILDRLWEHFSEGLKTYEKDPDPVRSHQGIQAVQQILAGLQIMDEYFEQYNLDLLDQGFKRFRHGCLLVIEQIQDSTGEALADSPTPSPQVNWVIHATRAILDGLGSDILERARTWFEPQLAESYFRFEQCASKALEGPARMAEQVPIARDGFDRLNRALPLLRLGMERRNLLHKAIVYLEDGADLLHQAWEIFVLLEEEDTQIQCVRCGSLSPITTKVCCKCGAMIIRPCAENEPEPPKVEQPSHLAVILQAVEDVQSGRISFDQYKSTLDWGRQLLRSAYLGVSRIGDAARDPKVAAALQILEDGMNEFKEALDELSLYTSPETSFHLEVGSTMLVRACDKFSTVQNLTQA